MGLPIPVPLIWGSWVSDGGFGGFSCAFNLGFLASLIVALKGLLVPLIRGYRVSDVDGVPTSTFNVGLLRL